MNYPSDKLKRLALQLVQEAEHRGAKLRLLGGMAIYLDSPASANHPVLKRTYNDLDFVVDRRGSSFIPDAFEARGWEPDRHFNALHGATRLLFTYRDEIQADLFVGEFVQCHKLTLERRLALHPVTLTQADLLLTKLQIHEMNRKDANDVFMLLLSCNLAPAQGKRTIDTGRIRALTGSDWGWYTTVHDNLLFLRRSLPKGLQPKEQAAIRSQLDRLKEVLEAAPKSAGWKTRNLIGRRIPWYDEPEEVHR
jgi:hypothetical protein